MKKVASILFLVVVATLVMAQTQVSIYDIQYTDQTPANSPYMDQEIMTTGIVTGTNFKGYDDNFFIQTPDGGVHQGAWCGVYVFKANFFNTNNPVVNVGDEVQVTGYVKEYNELTEISGNDDSVTVTILSSGNTLPTAVLETTDNLASNEAYEGVYVRTENVTMVGDEGQYGLWWGQDAVSTNPVQFDDGFAYWDTWTPVFTYTMNQTWTSLNGIYSYEYDEYKINPRGWMDIEAPTANDNPVVEAASALLIGNYPNPFNPETNVAFNLKVKGNVRIDIFNVSGQKISTLTNSVFEAGQHSVEWNGTTDNGSSVSSGIYFCRMQTSDYNATGKMILMK